MTGFGHSRRRKKETKNRKALVVIDIQNDITKHYRDIIDRLSAAVGWAADSGMEIDCESYRLSL